MCTQDYIKISHNTDGRIRDVKQILLERSTLNARIFCVDEDQNGGGCADDNILIRHGDGSGSSGKLRTKENPNVGRMFKRVLPKEGEV